MEQKPQREFAWVKKLSEEQIERSNRNCEKSFAYLSFRNLFCGIVNGALGIRMKDESSSQVLVKTLWVGEDIKCPFGNLSGRISLLSLSLCEQYLVLVLADGNWGLLHTPDLLKDDKFILQAHEKKEGAKKICYVEWPPLNKDRRSYFLTLDASRRLTIHYLQRNGQQADQIHLHQLTFITVCFSACGKYVYGITEKRNFVKIQVEPLRIIQKIKLLPLSWHSTLLPVRIYQPFRDIIIFGCFTKAFFAAKATARPTLVFMINFESGENHPSLYFYNLPHSLLNEKAHEFYFLFEKSRAMMIVGHSQAKDVSVFSLKPQGRTIKVGHLKTLSLENNCRGFQTNHAMSDLVQTDQDIPASKLLLADQFGNIYSQHLELSPDCVFSTEGKKVIPQDLLCFSNINDRIYQLQLDDELHNNEASFTNIPTVDERSCLNFKPQEVPFPNLKPFQTRLKRFNRDSSTPQLRQGRKHTCNRIRVRERSLPAKLNPPFGFSPLSLYKCEMKKELFPDSWKRIHSEVFSEKIRLLNSKINQLMTISKSPLYADDGSEEYVMNNSLKFIGQTELHRSSLQTDSSQKENHLSLFSPHHTSKVFSSPQSLDTTSLWAPARVQKTKNLSSTRISSKTQHAFGKNIVRMSHVNFTRNCDIIFSWKLSDIEIHAHKEVLIESCPFFKGLLQGGFKENYMNYILCEENFQAFAIMLQFIYFQPIQLTIESAYETIKLSRKYCLKELECYCENFLIGTYSSDNFGKLAQFAQEQELSKLLFYLNMEMIERPYIMLNYNLNCAYYRHVHEIHFYVSQMGRRGIKTDY